MREKNSRILNLMYVPLQVSHKKNQNKINEIHKNNH